MGGRSFWSVECYIEGWWSPFSLVHPFCRALDFFLFVTCLSSSFPPVRQGIYFGWVGFREFCAGAWEAGAWEEDRVEYFRGLFPSSVLGGRSMRMNPPLGVAANRSVRSSFTPVFVAQNSPTSGIRLCIGDVLGAH